MTGSKITYEMFLVGQTRAKSMEHIQFMPLLEGQTLKYLEKLAGYDKKTEIWNPKLARSALDAHNKSKTPDSKKKRNSSSQKNLLPHKKKMLLCHHHIHQILLLSLLLTNSSPIKFLKSLWHHPHVLIFLNLICHFGLPQFCSDLVNRE